MFPCALWLHCRYSPRRNHETSPRAYRAKTLNSTIRFRKLPIKSSSFRRFSILGFFSGKTVNVFIGVSDRVYHKQMFTDATRWQMSSQKSNSIMTPASVSAALPTTANALSDKYKRNHPGAAFLSRRQRCRAHSVRSFQVAAAEQKHWDGVIVREKFLPLFFLWVQLSTKKHYCLFTQGPTEPTK